VAECDEFVLHAGASHVSDGLALGICPGPRALSRLTVFDRLPGWLVGGAGTHVASRRAGVRCQRGRSYLPCSLMEASVLACCS